MIAHARREFVLKLGLLGLAASPLVAGAVSATSARTQRIGYINGPFPLLQSAFESELRRLGHTERDVAIEARVLSGAPDELKRYIAELADLKPELIVAGALPMALAVRETLPEMPMVIATCPGMVSNGFAQSLDKPGGIYTGMDELPPGVTAKRLTLLKEAAPQVSRIALLSTTPGRGGHEAQLADAEQAAGMLGVSVKPYRAATVAELDAALAAIAADRMDGLLNFQGGLSLRRLQAIVDFAAMHRLPAIYQATLFAEGGGLMTWAPDLEEQYREAARLTDKILRGAKPGDLPIKHPPRYFLTLNTAAAQRIGLPLPPELLARADRVLS